MQKSLLYNSVGGRMGGGGGDGKGGGGSWWWVTEGRVISFPSDLRHPLRVVYILRIGTALHTHKVLLLFRSAAQTPANQSDEDYQAG